MISADSLRPGAKHILGRSLAVAGRYALAIIPYRDRTFHR